MSDSSTVSATRADTGSPAGAAEADEYQSPSFSDVGTATEEIRGGGSDTTADSRISYYH